MRSACSTAFSVKYRGCYIDGAFRHESGGRARASISPWNGRAVMRYREYPSSVAKAFHGAALAFESWSRLTLSRRDHALRRLEREFRRARKGLAEIIHREMGKSLAEALGEVDGTLAKFAASRNFADDMTRREIEFQTGDGAIARFTWRPLGVMFIPGPFNFPLHIPNGHWVPALLAGNTVVFKPSDVTPAVGQAIAECAERAGLPPGVFQMIQGGPEIAKASLTRPELAGVLFTGSYATGIAIRRALVKRTGVITALEMGGNNPAIVCADADPRLAAVEIHKGATLTTGQRCTATRRAFVDRAIFERVLGELVRLFESTQLPPVATSQAYETYRKLRKEIAARNLTIVARGSRAKGDGFFVEPLVVRVEKRHRDLELLRQEWFLPILFLEMTRSLEEAMEGANATDYGLAASVFTRRRRTYEECRFRVRAGVINWNRATVGASSLLPFGGVGHSGNHRPAGIMSYAYCVHPLSSLEAAE